VHTPEYSGHDIEEGADPATVLPEDTRQGYDMLDLMRGIFDDHSVFQIKELFAPEVITAFARLDGKSVGVVASQPNHLGGVLFVDSADKSARFIWLCDAFNIPLIFLADVPGFMIGTAVERQGIIRSGAKMLTAIAEATVPRISVIVRKAYGAGLYAFSGPGLNPDATLALPTAEIAVMGPEAAVNAVFYNKIQALPEAEREAFVAERRAEYEEDVDLLHLSSEIIVDAVVQPEDLRRELISRIGYASRKDRSFSGRRHGVPPV
jgi:acetyl-CoA carboxylase carboxyltransferase component